MRSFRQVVAIARTEFRFGLRRGWPVVGTAAAGLIITAATLWIASPGTARDLTKYMPEAQAIEIGELALGLAWPAFSQLTLIVLPMVTAPAIPSDRQLHVDELLRSLPLAGDAYLAGKVLGTIVVVLLTGAVALAVHLILHLALIGPVNPGLYLELALLGALPLLLWVPAIGVLSGYRARTRRRAALIGLLVGLLIPWVGGIFTPWPPGPVQILNPLSWVMNHQPPSDFVLARYGLLLPGWVPAPTLGHVAMSLLTALLAVLVAGMFARAWLLQREDF